MAKIKPRSLALVLAFAALVIASPFALNGLDEDLNPQAVNYGMPHAATVAAQENAYYAYIALSAPGDDDGMEYARSWVAEQHAAAMEGRSENFPPGAVINTVELCDFRNAQCLTSDSSATAQYANALASYSTLLKRYENFLGFPQFEEVQDFPLKHDTAFPNGMFVASANRAWLLQAAVDFDAGNIDQAIAAIGRDITMQKTIMSGSNTLMAKMLASSNLLRDIEMVVQLLAHRKDAIAGSLPALRTLLAPLTTEALSMESALETEFQLQRTLFLEVLAERHLYKPNASFNLAYDIHQEVRAAAMQGANDLIGAAPVLWNTESSWLDLFDNLLGKAVLQITPPDYRKYSLRLQDMDAFLRSVSVLVEARIQAVEQDGMQTFLDATPAALHDPYTMQPMQWDAATGRVSFVPRGDMLTLSRPQTAGASISLPL